MLDGRDEINFNPECLVGLRFNGERIKRTAGQDDASVWRWCDLRVNSSVTPE